MFAHFPDPDECDQSSAAIALNPSQSDFQPPITLSGTLFVDVAVNAMLSLGRHATTAPACRNGCDGYNFALVVDSDGSLTGAAGTNILGEYAPLAFATPKCYPKPEWGAFVCWDSAFRNVAVSNKMVNVQSRRTLGPLLVTRMSPTDASVNQTYGVMGPSGDGCTSLNFKYGCSDMMAAYTEFPPPPMHSTAKRFA